LLTDGQLIGEDGVAYLGTYLPGLGKTIYFMDPKGKTLYNFSLDVGLTNKFTLTDFSNNGVSPIYETSVIIVPSVIDKTLFSTRV